MPTTTNYIWDEDNLLAEADGSNVVQTVYTNEPQQYGNLVSSRISGTTSYHHFDAIGSTRQLTNGAGNVTDTVIYDAWGNVVNRIGTTAIALLWIADVEYYCDKETGLVYVRERIHGPAIGRWTSLDRVGMDDVTHQYRYVLNRPLSLTDSSGLRPAGPGGTPDRPYPERAGTFYLRMRACSALDMETHPGCCCSSVYLKYTPSAAEAKRFTRICVVVYARSRFTYSGWCSNSDNGWHVDIPKDKQNCWPPIADWYDTPGGHGSPGWTFFGCPGLCHTELERQDFEGCAVGTTGDGNNIVIGCTWWGHECAFAYHSRVLPGFDAIDCGITTICEEDCKKTAITRFPNKSLFDIAPTPPKRSDWDPVADPPPTYQPQA